MINTSLSPTSSARAASALMQDLRATLTDLQRQLSTGEKSATYGGLGKERFSALNLQSKLSQMDGYSAIIQSSSLRLTLMDKSIGGVSDIINKAQTAVRAGTYEPNANGKPVAQVAADDQLKMMIDLMNVDIGGQYAFSGRATDTKPVATYDEIMNGTPGKAGLKTMIQERQTADLGTGGLGRLEAPSIAGSTVTLQRDATNPGAFGFTIASVATTSGNVAVSGPAGGLQTTTVGFTAQPNADETISLTLALPDGSNETLTLTATTLSPAPVGSFTIGATPAATAANFQAALQGAAQKSAETSLKSASAITAAKAFFAGTPTTPPQRVPSPAASATALVAGTTADTIVWYRGDDDTTAYPNARTTSLAKVGDALSVGVGARANESAMQQAFAMIGALAVVNVAPSDPNGQLRYSELSDRVRSGLGFPNNMQSVSSIQVELANANVSINSAKDRLTASKNVLTTSLDQIRTADPQEITASMLALQTRLEATYATTASLSKLSLVNYMS